MSAIQSEMTVQKEPLLDDLFNQDESAFSKYQQFFVGSRRPMDLLKYELVTALAGPWPGALGFLLRKQLYPTILGRVGRSAVWGRNVALRNPGRIKVGNRVGVDDDCMLDARGAGAEGIQIGDDVIIARRTILQAKTGWIKIGDRTVIGNDCYLASTGGISLGRAVMISGQCYIGGGRHHYDRRDIPMMDQGVYTQGPVVIEDDVWLGAGAIVLDGVRIGRGSIIGAGAVIRDNIPEYTVVTPHQKLVFLPRGGRAAPEGTQKETAA